MQQMSQRERAISCSRPVSTYVQAKVLLHTGLLVNVSKQYRPTAVFISTEDEQVSFPSLWKFNRVENSPIHQSKPKTDAYECCNFITRRSTIHHNTTSFLFWRQSALGLSIFIQWNPILIQPCSKYVSKVIYPITHYSSRIFIESATKMFR